MRIHIVGVVVALLACKWQCCSASSCIGESCPTMQRESLDLLQRSSSALSRPRSRNSATSVQDNGRPSTNSAFAQVPKFADAGCIVTTVAGDPHITVFDQAEVTLPGVSKQLARRERSEGAEDAFDWGDYWLVKSQEVSIQARYHKFYYPKASPPFSSTYLTAVAVGGPFLHGHKLVVEVQGGFALNGVWTLPEGDHKILFNGQGGGDMDEEKVFQEGHLIKATYSNRTAILPKAVESLVHGLDIELPSDVTLKIDRFGKHLDLRVQMPQSAAGDGGMDGQCGNYNGDASDDAAEQLEQRMRHQVLSGERLFSA